MKTETRWWDGPWPWLFYMPAYVIPWVWTSPTLPQLLVSGLVFAVFLPVYFMSFRLVGCRLGLAVGMMILAGVAAVPIGGGWTVFAVYPAMQAARIRPLNAAIAAIVATLAVFALAGLIVRQPLVWWLPSLMVPALLAGAALSREAFYDRTRALLVTQEEVRRLAGLAERERMARDLHDTVGRTLTLLALRADLVSRVAADNPATARAEARTIADEARAGLAEVGAALSGHGGGSLDREIEASLAALRTAGLDAQVHGAQPSPPPDTGALLAMTLREAVTNVIRHARASRCDIGIEIDAESATLSVIDDGVGPGRHEGRGLSGMRQRLFAAGGVLSILDKHPGTAVIARAPL